MYSVKLGKLIQTSCGNFFWRGTEYDKEYWGTYGQYLVVEIIYDDNSKRFTEVIEKELVVTYLYEIADNLNISLSFSEIKNPNYDYFDRIEEAEENPIQELRELIPYNEGMRLYLSAIQIKDQELKFLNFYKVLEHFSPIAINIEAYELMRKKLDVPKRQIITGDYIKSIFDLANIMKSKFNDEELLKSAFNNCFDFVGLFDKLPEIIKENVRKQCKVAELSYKTDKDKIEIARNMVGAIVYKTRNKVVHAKSNYKKTREELEIEDIEILNDFMREATSQAIRWYARLPEHLKLELIK